jgi:hypothetical protein
LLRKTCFTTDQPRHHCHPISARTASSSFRLGTIRQRDTFHAMMSVACNRGRVRIIPEGRSDPIGLQSMNTPFPRVPTRVTSYLTHVISGDEFDCNPHSTEGWTRPVTWQHVPRMAFGRTPTRHGQLVQNFIAWQSWITSLREILAQIPTENTKGHLWAKIVLKKQDIRLPNLHDHAMRSLKFGERITLIFEMETDMAEIYKSKRRAVSLREKAHDWLNDARFIRWDECRPKTAVAFNRAVRPRPGDASYHWCRKRKTAGWMSQD